MTKKQFLSLKTGDLLFSNQVVDTTKRSGNLFMFTKRQKVQLESGLPPYYIIYHFDFSVGFITKFELYHPWEYYDKA